MLLQFLNKNEPNVIKMVLKLLSAFLVNLVIPMFPSFCNCCYSLDSDFLTCSATGKTHIEVQHFRVQYPLDHWLLYLSATVEKITIRWIALSTIRTTGS